MISYIKILEEITRYPWFTPANVILRTVVTDLKEKHLERLKPFGYAENLSSKFGKIWPGKSSKEIIEIHNHAHNSLWYMIINSILGVIREIAVKNSRIKEMDEAVCEISSKVRRVVNKIVIDRAGITL